MGATGKIGIKVKLPSWSIPMREAFFSKRLTKTNHFALEVR